MALITPEQVVSILDANKEAGIMPSCQTELAAAAGMSRVVLNRWIRGTRADIKLQTASRIAAALGLRLTAADGTAIS